MAGFEPQICGVESDPSANRAKITTHALTFLIK